MAKKIEPYDHSVCVACGKPVLKDQEYHYAKSTGFPAAFMHVKCYEKQLKKRGVEK